MIGAGAEGRECIGDPRHRRKKYIMGICRKHALMSTENEQKQQNLSLKPVGILLFIEMSLERRGENELFLIIISSSLVGWINKLKSCK